MKSFTLLHSNIRGLRSKSESLDIVNSIIKPDAITLNEHGIRGNNKVNIVNYKTFSKNRSDSRMGGVSFSIRNDKISSCTMIKEGTSWAEQCQAQKS